MSNSVTPSIDESVQHLPQQALQQQYTGESRLKIIAFQIATTAKGRGVLRLLLLQQQINLFCIPAICLQLFMVTYPSSTMALPLCVILEILFVTVETNRSVSILTVGLGRYNHEVFEDVRPAK